MEIKAITRQQKRSSSKRNPFQSQQLPKSNNFKARLNTLQKLSDEKIHHFSHSQKLKSQSRLLSGSQRLITEVQRIKKLSPVKQYQTRLKVSAESWMTYDMKTQSYKRGWEPNKVGQFDGLLRMVVFYVACKLFKQSPSINDYQVRFNIQTLKILSPKKHQSFIKNHRVKIEPDRNYANLGDNAIIKYRDLILATIMTDNEDLLQYSVMFTGYLVYCLRQNQKLQLPYCFLSEPKHSNTYNFIFTNYINNNLCKQFNLKLTKVTNKLELRSTPNEICEIFKRCLSQKLFRDTIKNEKLSFIFKFQVGYNFWEDRQKKYINKSHILNNDNYFCFLNFRGKRNYSIALYNTGLQIIIILEDSKFGMAMDDANVIEQWVRMVRKPIVKVSSLSKIKNKLNPIPNILQLKGVK